MIRKDRSDPYEEENLLLVVVTQKQQVTSVLSDPQRRYIR